LIVLLWRVGLRINEALTLTEPDLDARLGAILVRHGQGSRRREVGWTPGAGTTSAPASSCACACPSGRCCA
jgi:site-specific recombinase XerD